MNRNYLEVDPVSGAIMSGSRTTHLSTRETDVSNALMADVLTIALQSRGQISRRDIARRLSVKLGSVSKAVKPLLDHGYLRESGKDRAGQGRPATLLEAGDSVRLIGLYMEDVEHSGSDVTESNVTGVITSLDGRVVGHPERMKVRVGSHLSADQRAATVASDVAAFVKTRLIPRLSKNDTVVGLGLTVGGRIRNGDILRSYNLGWHVPEPVPLREHLQERLGLEADVMVENEATALADHAHWFGDWRRWFASGSPPRTFLTVLVTPTGVGGGFYLDGRRYNGGTGINGEIGHVKFERGRRALPCRCGRKGCIEAYAATSKMLENIRKRNLEQKDLEQKDLEQAAHTDHDEVVKIFAKGGSALGAGLASFINHVGPEAIVIFTPEELAKHWPPPSESSTTAGSSYWAALRQAIIAEAFPGGDETPVQVVPLSDSFPEDLAIAAAISALDATIRRIRKQSSP